jgi:agmatinase
MSHNLLEGIAVHWNNFLDLPPEQSDPSTARVVVIPIPYDSTTSYKGGARDGPRAIIRASGQLEDYDLELDRDIAQLGIHTTPELMPNVGGPEAMIEQVRRAVLSVAARGGRPLLALLGGEHTVTVGAAQAMAQLYPDLSVLYLDAHADLRDEYMGAAWGHASVARRVYDICPTVHVGVRTVSAEEMEFIRKAQLPVFFWTSPSSDISHLARDVINSLSPHVYVSVDLDVLDPSLMAAVGTPEPGGMTWREATALLRAVGEQRQIVGFDVVELSPSEGPEACAFTAAKLAYKLIGYATAE